MHPPCYSRKGESLLNENLIYDEIFFVRDKEQTSITLACSILHSLNENFLTVYDVDTSLERLNITLNACTRDGVDYSVVKCFDVLDTSCFEYDNNLDNYSLTLVNECPLSGVNLTMLVCSVDATDVVD